MYKKLIIGLTAVVALSGAAMADEEASTYDKIWGYGTLVDNDDANVLQSLSLTGRLQADGFHYEDDNDNSLSDFKWRRFRIGAKATLFQDFLLHGEVDINLNEWGRNDSYNRLTDVYAAWAPSKAFKLKAGKQSAGFTLDGATSSKKLITMERSIVAGNLWFPTEYFTGLSGSGATDGWDYKLGGFSSSGDNEFGEFDAGWFALASIGRDIGDNVYLRLDYVHNDPDYDEGTVGTKNLDNIGSFVTKSQFDKLGFWTDLSYATGIDTQSDLFGLELMPFWNFSDMWQVVGQYALVHSTDDPGASLSRYSKKIDSSKFETAQDFYLGLNCFLYGHKLKWQNGIQYVLGSNDAAGNDYNGWGVTTGVRISW